MIDALILFGPLIGLLIWKARGKRKEIRNKENGGKTIFFWECISQIHSFLRHIFWPFLCWNSWCLNAEKVIHSNRSKNTTFWRSFLGGNNEINKFVCFIANETNRTWLTWNVRKCLKILRKKVMFLPWNWASFALENVRKRLKDSLKRVKFPCWNQSKFALKVQTNTPQNIVTAWNCIWKFCLFVQ